MKELGPRVARQEDSGTIAVLSRISDALAKDQVGKHRMAACMGMWRYAVKHAPEDIILPCAPCTTGPRSACVPRGGCGQARLPAASGAGQVRCTLHFQQMPKGAALDSVHMQLMEFPNLDLSGQFVAVPQHAPTQVPQDTDASTEAQRHPRPGHLPAPAGRQWQWCSGVPGAYHREFVCHLIVSDPARSSAVLP